MHKYNKNTWPELLAAYPPLMNMYERDDHFACVPTNPDGTGQNRVLINIYHLINFGFSSDYFPRVGDCTVFDESWTVGDWQDFYANMFGYDNLQAVGEVQWEYFGRDMNYLYERPIFQCMVARNPELKGMY